MFHIIDKHQDPKMNLWMQVNDHKIQMYIFISFYVVNQYHTKSAISVFLLQNSAWLKCDIVIQLQNVAE